MDYLINDCEPNNCVWVTQIQQANNRRPQKNKKKKITK